MSPKNQVKAVPGIELVPLKPITVPGGTAVASVVALSAFATMTGGTPGARTTDAAEKTITSTTNTQTPSRTLPPSIVLRLPTSRDPPRNGSRTANAHSLFQPTGWGRELGCTRIPPEGRGRLRRLRRPPDDRRLPG